MSALLVAANAVAWIALCALAVVIYALARQVGVLHERIAPAGALASNRQLRAGAAAPRVAATLLHGGSLEIGAPRADGRSQLIFFLSPDCPLCKTLLPAAVAAANAARERCETVFAGDGAAGPHHELERRFGLGDFSFALSPELARSYGVVKLPYAVLIDEHGNVAALGSPDTREQLAGMFDGTVRGGAVQHYMEQGT